MCEELVEVLSNESFDMTSMDVRNGGARGAEEMREHTCASFSSLIGIPIVLVMMIGL